MSRSISVAHLLFTLNPWLILLWNLEFVIGFRELLNNMYLIPTLEQLKNDDKLRGGWNLSCQDYFSGTP